MEMENAWWVKKHKRLLCEFCAHLPGSHFCSKDPSWDSKGQPKEWKCKVSDGQTNINDVYVNFARTCQDHSFAARLKVGTQRNSQGSENGKCSMDEKHKRFLNEFCAHLSCPHFCSKVPSWDTKGQPNEWNWKMSDGHKRINNVYVNFARACQDHTFVARNQAGIPRGSQRNENGKCLMGLKT